MVFFAALASAVAYAVAMVLQQRSARSVAPDHSLKPGLLVQLMQRRVWLAGMAFNAVAFGMRAMALAEGTMAVVQPLILTGLFFALVLETWLDHRPFTPREAGGSAALIVGLGLFVWSADPQGGVNAPPAMDWLLLGTILGGGALVTVPWAKRLTGDRRAACLACGGAMLLSLTAALTKLVASAAADDGLDIVRTWQPYALLLVGAMAVLVTQSAFQAGPLRASLPVLSVVEPLAGILIGAWMFEERVGTSLWARAGEGSGIALLTAGVILLTAGARPTEPAPTTRPSPASEPIP
jgi:drug/metabolite transporter (DMT)-like permease